MAHIITVFENQGGVGFLVSEGLSNADALQMMQLIEHELQRRIVRAEIEAEAEPQEVDSERG